MQHRFQQELLDSLEYRSLLEQELSGTLGMTIEVVTVLAPEPGGPRRQR
jgi:hypothetical protein